MKIRHPGPNSKTSPDGTITLPLIKNGPFSFSNFPNKIPAGISMPYALGALIVAP
jgi:hypothetical protein